MEGDDDVALASFTASELDAVVDNDLKFQITVLQEKLTKMKPNIASIAEYKKKVVFVFYFCSNISTCILIYNLFSTLSSYFSKFVMQFYLAVLMVKILISVNSGQKYYQSIQTLGVMFASVTSIVVFDD